MKRSHSNSESGSAILLIFIAIALFAAISYAVFSGGRQSASSLSKDQARIAAREMVDYTNTLVKTVQTLRLRGCTDADFYFHNTQWVRVNGNIIMGSKSSFLAECHVFGDAGKMKAEVFPASYFVDKTLVPLDYATGSGLIHAGFLLGVGNSAPELLYFIGRVKDDVCKEINKILEIPEPDVIPEHSFSGSETAYTGAYTSYVTIAQDDPDLYGRGAFCGKRSGRDNSFYVTLIAR